MDDDLACGCPDALPLVAGALLGLAATAGWFRNFRSPAANMTETSASRSIPLPRIR